MTANMDTTEARAALTQLRGGIRLFGLFVSLSLIIQIAIFAMVEFFGVLDPVRSAITGEPPVRAKAVQPAATQPTDPTNTAEVVSPEAAWTWLGIFRFALSTTKFAAVVSGAGLLLILLMCSQLSVAARLGGSDGFLGAFVWSVLLVLMLVPWQQALNTSLACGATYNLGQLTHGLTGKGGPWGEEANVLYRIVYYVRFGGYPLIALLVWVLIMAKYFKGRREIDKRLGKEGSPEALNASGVPFE